MAKQRLRVRGVRRTEIDADKLALAYWLMAKHAVDQKRSRAAEAKRTVVANGTRSRAANDERSGHEGR